MAVFTYRLPSIISTAQHSAIGIGIERHCHELLLMTLLYSERSQVHWHNGVRWQSAKRELLVVTAPFVTPEFGLPRYEHRRRRREYYGHMATPEYYWGHHRVKVTNTGIIRAAAAR